MAQIEVKNLNLYYGEKKALNNLNIAIEKKSVTALIGPSGCGKSTFLRCLNRMNDLIETCKIDGEIKINNHNIYNDNQDLTDLRTRVGMVFQNPNPFDMSIFENIVYGLRILGLRDKKELEKRCIEALKGANLYEEVADRLKENALGLSGGQQQRLCIARAIATNPEIILMDEPTSALDPVSTSKIEELITELKNNYTVVIVTHNMQQALRISDMTAFFLLGDIVEYDKTQKIFAKPENKLTENYISGRFG